MTNDVIILVVLDYITFSQYPDETNSIPRPTVAMHDHCVVIIESLIVILLQLGYKLRMETVNHPPHLVQLVRFFINFYL